MSTAIDYDTTPIVLERAHLDALEVTVDENSSVIDISGPCPRCTHFVHFVIPEREFSPDSGGGGATSAAAGPASAGITIEAEEWVGAAPPAPQAPPEPHARKPRRGDRSVALHCNCATTHSDQHSHKPGGGGCGAWFSVTLEDQHTKRPRLDPGPELSLYEEHNADARDTLAEGELVRLRAAAAGWKTGLAALVALIPTLVVVKGTDTVDKLARFDAIVVGMLIAVGAVSAVIAALLALRAANGPLSQWKMSSDDLRPFREHEVDQTIMYLRFARKTTVLAAASLAAAIAYAWAAPQPKPGLSVSLANGTGFCGTLVGVNAGVMQIETKDGVTRAISTAHITSVTSVSSC